VEQIASQHGSKSEACLLASDWFISHYAYYVLSQTKEAVVTSSRVAAASTFVPRPLSCCVHQHAHSRLAVKQRCRHHGLSSVVWLPTPLSASFLLCSVDVSSGRLADTQHSLLPNCHKNCKSICIIQLHEMNYSFDSGRQADIPSVL